MNFNSLVSAMSAETYQKLVDAVATKRWADGTLLSDDQHAQTMQLVMAYQAKVLRSDEPFTIGTDGQMVVKSKAEMKQQLDAAAVSTPAAPQAAPFSDTQAAVTIARFAHDDL
jgi:uncharacterized protein YeaC (DUF1315 family)